MATNIVSLRELDEYISHTPPLTHDIVTKALSRETDMISKQYEIYDILIQSTEQKHGVDIQWYYARAHKIDPHYTRFLYNNYYNTDEVDLNAFILTIPEKLDKIWFSKVYVKIKTEDWYEKTSTREVIKAFLEEFLSKNYIEHIEKKIEDIGINNLYTIAVLLQPSWLFLQVFTAKDTDWDVMEKIDPDNLTKSDFLYTYPLSFDQTYKLALFIRKLSWIKWDISDCFMFD